LFARSPLLNAGTREVRLDQVTRHRLEARPGGPER
jgi:hypothetical protein